MDVMLSESKLRMIAESRGYPVNHKQFVAYRDVGLIPAADPVSKRWPPETVDQLVRIRELGRTVRSLSRRVLLLRHGFGFQDLPAAAIRRAMIDVIPTIQQPMHKLQRVNVAILLMEGGETAQNAATRPPTRLADLPAYDTWMGVLERADLELVANWLPGCYWHATVAMDVSRRWDRSLDDIPYEEMVIMLMIHKLAWRERTLHSHVYAR